MDLVHVVAEFYGKPPGSVRIAMITAPSGDAVTKQLLEAAIGCRPVAFPAIDGVEYVRNHPEFPVACAFEPAARRTPEEIGQLLSHVELIREALDQDAGALVVFENNCVPGMRRTEFLTEIQKYLEEIRRLEREFQLNWISEIVLLGSSGTYEFTPIGHHVKATSRFNGAHAYMVSRVGMEAILAAYESLQTSGAVAPVDGLFGLVSYSRKAHLMCPLKDNAFVGLLPSGAEAAAATGQEIHRDAKEK